MAQNVVINGVTYQDCPEVDIPKSGGGTAKFYDTTDATAGVGDVLATKTFHADGKKTGNMANNGDTSGTISTKAGTVSIPSGYTSGGTVAISSTEQAKVVSGNIKSGVTILGVSGSSMVVDTTVSSDPAAASTIVNGKKAFVNGSLVTGQYVAPVISQDAQSKILSIS